MIHGPRVRVASQGPAGPTGPTGPQGPAGTGSGTAVPGPMGPPGLDGLDGLDGDPGPVGATGAAGVAGAAGPMGPPGLDGLDGADGADGPPGPAGATGATGPAGPMGPPGIDGQDGVDGLDGATSHHALTGLLLDDHSQYALLAGRAGGQMLIGGVAAGEGLSLKGGGGATGNINVDLTAGDQITFQPNPVSTAIQTMLQILDPVSMGAASRLSGFVINSTVTWTASPNSIPYLVFNWNVPTIYANAGSATNISNRTATIFRDTGSYSVTGAGAGTLKTGTHRTVHSAPIFSATLAASTFSRVEAVYFQPVLNDANWTNADNFAVFVDKPGGSAAATLTRWGGINIEDPAGIVPLIGTAYSVRSKGASVRFSHAGAGVFGADAAPTTVSVGLELSSVTLAMLLSRMTVAQRNALTAADGMILYDSDAPAGFDGRVGGSWRRLLDVASGVTEVDLDVGSTPVLEATINTVDANVTVNSKIIFALSGKPPTGKDETDSFIENIVIRPIPKAGSIDWYIRAIGAPNVGDYPGVSGTAWDDWIAGHYLVEYVAA